MIDTKRSQSKDTERGFLSSGAHNRDTRWQSVGALLFRIALLRYIVFAVMRTLDLDGDAACT